MEELRQSFRDAEKRASEADKSVQDAQEELERVRPFEKEVKEKNLLIGKLRHEAVTLNDHLTKALRFLKKGKPEDNVDRYCFVYALRYRAFANWDRLGISSQTICCISSLSTDQIRRNSKSCSSLQHCWDGQTVSQQLRRPMSLNKC